MKKLLFKIWLSFVHVAIKLGHQTQIFHKILKALLSITYYPEKMGWNVNDGCRDQSSNAVRLGKYPP